MQMNRSNPVFLIVFILFIVAACGFAIACASGDDDDDSTAGDSVDDDADDDTGNEPDDENDDDTTSDDDTNLEETIIEDDNEGDIRYAVNFQETLLQGFTPPRYPATLIGFSFLTDPISSPDLLFQAIVCTEIPASTPCYVSDDMYLSQVGQWRYVDLSAEPELQEHPFSEGKFWVGFRLASTDALGVPLDTDADVLDEAWSCFPGQEICWNIADYVAPAFVMIRPTLLVPRP